MNNEYEIQKLMNQYARYLDQAEFEKFGQLLGHARYIHPGNPDEVIFDKDPQGIAEFMRGHTKLQDDGTPGTLILVTNHIIDIDESGLTATGFCYNSLYHSNPGVSVDPMAIAHYEDKFEKADGKWRFSERRIVPRLMADLSGLAEEHALPPEG